MRSTNQLPGPAAPAPRPAAGGCRTCPVRHYCTLYSPYATTMPANCPFGTGPAGS